MGIPHRSLLRDRLRVEDRRSRFDALARQHEGDLLRAARRLCRGDADRAQDLVQEALIHAYVGFVGGRFQEGTNARAWLLRILTNDFLNDCDRRRRAATVDLESLTVGGQAGPPAAHAPAADTPGSALMDRTLDEPLERALACLSEGLRLCVVLVDIEEMDYAQTAAALGIPIGTVRSRLARARLQLRALLQDHARDQRRL